MKNSVLLVSILMVLIVQIQATEISNNTTTVSSKRFFQAIANTQGSLPKGIYNWKMPHHSKAFTWYPEKNSWSSAGFERTGKVYFTNKGKITHRMVQENIQDGYWEVKFIGTKNKISLITLIPNELSEENPSLEIEKLFIKRKMLCTKNAEETALLYHIQYPHKKAYWMKSLKVHSSSGRGEIYQISFDGKPKCQIEDESAGKKQKYITRCTQLAGTQTAFQNIYTDQAIGACEIAVEISPDNAQVLYALGRAYKKSGNIKKALMWYRKASDLNSADAKYALGKMFLKGEGIKQNRAFAKVMFEGATKGGSIDAMVWLGILYVQGINGEKNYSEAERIFRKAISLGSITAKKNLTILNNLREKEKKKLNDKKISTSNQYNDKNQSSDNTISYQ